MDYYGNDNGNQNGGYSHDPFASGDGPSFQGSGFQGPNFDGGGPRGKKPRKPLSARQKSTLKVVALCLVCALVGGLAHPVYNAVTGGNGTTIYTGNRTPTKVDTAAVNTEKELTTAEIYAKYVSDSYLDLHYVRNGLFRLRGVTLISAVDNPANYQESGIIVDGVKVPVAYANRYRLFYTASGLFGAARNARLMITQQRLFGSGTLEVTPYWVTKDGTTVLGQPHTLHYSARGIWE